MPDQLEHHIIRIACDMANPRVAIIDKLTSETPQFWRGNDLRFEVALLRNGEVLDVGNLSSITLEVRSATDIDGTPLMQKSVAAGSLDNTVTTEAWEDDTKQHANFDFTDTETNLDSPGDDHLVNWEVTHYLVVSGLTTAGNVITYAAGPIIFREDGAGSAGTPPTNDPNYYTTSQSDARFLQLTGGTLSGALTLAADPTVALGAATKQYVDAATSNGAWKKPVRAASTANVNTASAPATLDGVTLASGDRLLLKDQTAGAENGIYTFSAAGAALTRASDCNSSALCEPGFAVRVNEGTANADRAFALTTNATITLGTTALTFAQTSALGQVTVPAGLTKTTNEALAWHASTHATPAGLDLATTGGAAAPALSRSGDTNTGLDMPAADTIIAATGGVERWRTTDTGLGIHKTPAVALDVAGEVAISSRIKAQALETDAGAVEVLDAQVATVASNDLPFPNDGNVLSVGAGTVNTVSNVRTGALYVITATGALIFTDSASINCPNGANIVLASGEAVLALGLSPTSVALVAPALKTRLADGTAAAPALFFDQATTMGFFRSAANILGLALAGVERAKLGLNGSNVELEIPTYNFIIDPADTTAGRGNVGLMGQTTFDSTGKQVVAWKSGTAPAGNLADAVQMWVADRGATAGEASLHMRTEGGDLHVLGDRVGLFTHTPEADTRLEVYLGAGTDPYARFIGEGAIGDHLQITNYNAGAAGVPTLDMQRARGNRTTPAAIQTGDILGGLQFNGYDGTVFQNNAFLFCYAGENWSGTNRGCSLKLWTTPNGSTAVVSALALDENNCALFYGATRPTALAKGLVIPDGTAASADPSAAAALWSASGALQYRTSGAGEGAGQINNVHNRSAEVAGSGTDYTLTAGTARVDFGTTDAEVALPTAGTYLVTAEVAITNGATATDNYQAKLYNSTDAAEITNSIKEVGAAAASQKLVIQLRALVTVTAAKTIQIYAHNTVAARGTVVSTQTAIRYTRLY